MILSDTPILKIEDGEVFLTWVSAVMWVTIVVMLLLIILLLAMRR